MRVVTIFLIFLSLLSCTNNTGLSKKPLSFNKWVFTTEPGKKYYFDTPKNIIQNDQNTNIRNTNEMYKNMSAATVTITDENNITTEEKMEIILDSLIYLSISTLYNNFQKEIIKQDNDNVMIILKLDNDVKYRIHYKGKGKIEIICY